MGRKIVSRAAAALLALAAVSLAGQFFAAGQEATAGLAPQTAVKDAAITALVNPRPPFATAGATLTIPVTAQNLGSSTETIAVVLEDTTDNREVNRVFITLDANEKGVILFIWDTSTASVGVHILRATATLAGDTNAANNSLTNAPGLLIRPRPRPAIAIDAFAAPDAQYGQGVTMTRPAITTPAHPLTALFIGPAAQATLTDTLTSPSVATLSHPRQELFIGGAVVSYQPGRVFLNPFRRGEVRGRVKLQSRKDSRGGYVQVGNEVHFLEADGSFRAAIPSGVQDLYIRAPGYVSALIPGANINPGELLTLPELTLPFGDANGDGRVDILDLAIAGNNFGDTIRRLPPP